MATDFDDFLATAAALKKASYKCPAENCQKVYKMFAALKKHCEKHQQEQKERERVLAETSENSENNDSAIQHNQTLSKRIKEIFTKSQQACNVNHCVEMLSRVPFLEDSEKGRIALEALKHCVNFALAGDEKCPMTINVLEFIAKYCVKQANGNKANTTVVQPQDDDSSNSSMDELYMALEDEYKENAANQMVAIQIVDVILDDMVRPNLLNEMVCVRINACVLIRIILGVIDDLSDTVCERLRDGLIQRMADKSPAVRGMAARALHRFQGQDTTSSVLVSAFRHHMASDTEADVRVAVLCAIEINRNTLPEIIRRTRDVRDLVRKMAYRKISNCIVMRQLSMAQRMSILQQGLTDRNVQVQKIVSNDLVTSWLKSCDNEPEKLLEFLDIENYEEICEKLMASLFEYLRKQSVDDRRTKFHLYVEQFSAKYLDNRRLLPKEEQTKEIAFLWYTMAKFAKEHAAQLNFMVVEEEENNPEMEEVNRFLATVNLSLLEEEGDVSNVNSQNSSCTSIIDMEGLERNDKETTKQMKASKGRHAKEDLLSMLIPEIPHFCKFLKKYVEDATEVRAEISEEQKAEVNYIFSKLTSLMLMVDITEEAQRKIVKTTFTDMMFMPNTEEVFENLSKPLMEILYKKIFRNTPELYEYTKALTTRLYNEIHHDEGQQYFPEEESFAEIAKNDECLSEEEKAAFEMEVCRLGMQIEEIRDELEKAIEQRNYAEAEQYKNQLNELKTKRDDINKRKSLAIVAPSQPVSTQPKQPVQPDDDQLRTLYLKGSQIFSSAIRTGKPTKMNDFIRSHIDRIVFPAMLSTDPDARYFASLSIGLVALFDGAFAKQRFNLFASMINDQPNVKATGLRVIFDILIRHGLDRFTVAEKPVKSRESSEKENEEPFEEASISDSESELERPKKKQKVESEEENNELTVEEFIDILIPIFTQHLNSDCPDIRHVTVEGVAKLLQHGRILSPVLLHSLIMIWYCEATEPKTKHFLGVFLPFFAYADNTRALNAEPKEVPTLQQCFIPTIKTAVNNTNLDEHGFTDPFMDDQQIENMISYMIALLHEEVHADLFIDLLNEILEILPKKRNDKEALLMFYYKAMMKLTLHCATEEELESIKNKTDRAEMEIKRKITTGIGFFKGKFRVLNRRIEAAAQKFLPDENAEELNHQMILEEEECQDQEIE